MDNQALACSNGEWREITTPYLDDANDCIQIYVRQSGSTFCLTDDGATIAGLKMAGVQIHAARRTHLQQILSEYGVVLRDDELVTTGPLDSFEQKKSLLVQAILNVIRAGQLMRKKDRKCKKQETRETKTELTWTYVILYPVKRIPVY